MPICPERVQQLAEQFATAARLYAEAVVLLTTDPVKSTHDYTQLFNAVDEAQRRVESTGLAFREHVYLHSPKAKSSSSSN
ncbi:MAG: hypothetical protein ACJ74Z_06895 [Bryobacteraceae bacterium]